jgi:RNA polymerase sigma-70 factor (ECF subfamily)
MGTILEQREVQKLFLEHASWIRGFLLGFVPVESEAQDLFQEVFLTVLDKAQDFALGTNFQAWVRAIAKFKLLEQGRLKQRNPLLLDPALLAMLEAANAELDLVREERKRALAECIEQLAPRARQILEMRYGDQPVAPAEIARQLSWTPGAVYVALSQARAFLRECTRRRLGMVEG